MSVAPNTQPSWRRSTLAIAIQGSLLLFAALPPLSLSWLAWIAPVPWLMLVRADALPSRRPYRALWLAGFIFWLMAIHWLRLPHPAVYFGWLALSAYLAIYLPIFVGLSRLAVHRIGVPLWIAAPVVWTGLELARAHLLTGFLMGSLAHTQVHWTALIQISDLFGEYGVDFMIVLVASCIASVAPLSYFFPQQRAVASTPPSENTASKPAFALFLKFTPAVVVVAATLYYGHTRLNQLQSPIAEPSRTARIALIQGNSLADWKMDHSKQSQIMAEYTRLSAAAVDKAKSTGDGRSLDLIVWPETMYRNPLREFESGYKLPEGVPGTPEEILATDRKMLADLVAYVGTPLLVGIDRVQFLATDSKNAAPPRYRAYNSAALIDSSGKVVGTYDKFHLVMFGEYVPFAGLLPFLNNVSSITGSVLAGDGPVLLCEGGVCYAPSICYETVIPHVARQQANFAAKTLQPNVLINLTNDAWYWGSSELDQHLACGVFRAVEARKPLVIAANGGISAWIDHTGRIRAQSPKQEPDVIIADVEIVPTSSSYLRFGDWFAGLCLTFCIALAIIGWITRRTQTSPAPGP